MKPHQWRRSKAGPYLRRLPRLKNMKGTWAHKWFGEKILAPELWQPERSRFAAGAAVGVFFAMLPLPLQTLGAITIAILTRINIPAAVLFTWVNNPLTLPLFLYWQYKLGSWLLGTTDKNPPEGGLVETLSNAPLPVLVGACIFGIVCSLASFPIVLAGWDFVTARLLHRDPNKPLTLKRKPTPPEIP